MMFPNGLALFYKKGTDGEVANALVCKTSIRGFDPLSVLHKFNGRDFQLPTGVRPIQQQPFEKIVVLRLA